MTDQPNQNEKHPGVVDVEETYRLLNKSKEPQPDAVQAVYTCSCNEYKLRISELERRAGDILEEKIANLTQTIATERDAFGKRETELVAKITELEKELFAFKYVNGESKLLEESRLQIQAQKKVIENLVLAIKNRDEKLPDLGMMSEAKRRAIFEEEALQSAAELENKGK